MNAVMHLEAISRTFPVPDGRELTILQGLDLMVNTGDMIAIQGRSGSGKSTLLNLMGLLDLPSSGRVLIDGTDAGTLNDAKRAGLRGARLGFVFQQFHLLQGRTALQNVAEPLIFGTPGERRERLDRASWLLERVGLGDRQQAMPHLLSGGEQQRVAIARALARKPGVILADEPTGSLDVSTGEQVMQVLGELVTAEQTSLVIVTHDERVAAYAKQRLVLAEGRLHEVTT